MTGYSIRVFWVLIVLVACADLSWEPPTPGSVMAELVNPDQGLSARVIATKVQGTYTLEVRRVRDKRILAERNISAPVGYHPHMVSLTWSEDGSVVSATIDHDFGEGNRVFDLPVSGFDPS